MDEKAGVGVCSMWFSFTNASPGTTSDHFNQAPVIIKSAVVLTRERAGTEFSGNSDSDRESCRRPSTLLGLCHRYVLIMQVLVILLACRLLPLDGLAFSWPRQTTETIVETSIPEDLSSLGGLARSSFCITLIDVVKTVCSVIVN